MKTKAVHSTIKRIMLTHMQIVTLCFSLHVPWPNLLITMVSGEVGVAHCMCGSLHVWLTECFFPVVFFVLSLLSPLPTHHHHHQMDIFSSLSSVSQHVISMSCYVEDVEGSNPVRKQAAFLYLLTGCILLVPLLFGVVLYIWWLILVPLRCCRWMSCGLSRKLVVSRICCCQKKTNVSRTDVQLRMHSNARSKRKRLSFQEVEVLQDTTVKTRDVWTYSIVLFCFMVSGRHLYTTGLR